MNVCVKEEIVRASHNNYLISMELDKVGLYRVVACPMHTCGMSGYPIYENQYCDVEKAKRYYNALKRRMAER